MFAKALQAAILIVALFFLSLFIEKAIGFHSSLSDLQLVASFFSYILQAVLMGFLAIRYSSSISKNGSVFSFVLMTTMFVVVASPLVEMIFASVISPEFFQLSIRKEIESGGDLQLARKTYNVGTFAMNRMIYSGVVGLAVAVWAKVRIKD